MNFMTGESGSDFPLVYRRVQIRIKPTDAYGATWVEKCGREKQQQALPVQ